MCIVNKSHKMCEKALTTNEMCGKIRTQQTKRVIGGARLRDWLKKIRQEKHFTLQKVSAIVGISKSYYEKIERGERTPSVDVAKKIANVLGFPWEKFFEDGEVG